MDKVCLKQAVAEALTEFEAHKALPLEVRRVRLKPGDTLILRTPMPLTQAAAERMTAALRARFGDTQQVLILEQGLDLEVLSKETTNGA